MNRPSCHGHFPQYEAQQQITRGCAGCQYINDCMSKTERLMNNKPIAEQEIREAVKKDADKPMPELLPFAALVEVADVLAYGARKYSAHNWRKGMIWSRMLGAALRHLLAWGGGQDKDPETGKSHLAHAACNILFLLDYEMTGGYKDLDDRAKGRGEQVKPPDWLKKDQSAQDWMMK